MMVDEHATDTYTKSAISRLINDDMPVTVVLDQCGKWSDIVKSILQAQQESGKEGARQVFNVLVKQYDALAQLIADAPVPARLFRTAEEIMNTTYPPLKWIVPDLIPEGLAMLGGRPKVGKSWLALHIANAVAIGGETLGRQVPQGKVLYIACEDSGRRINERLHTIGAAKSKNLFFAEEWPFLDRRGAELLEQVIQQEGFDLVILDTFTRMLEKSDQTNSSEMAAVLGPLQRMTIDYGFSLHIVDHHNKLADPDTPLSQSLFGSVAKSGVADVLVGLFRKETERQGRLKISGRDVSDLDMVVHLSEESAVWQITGNAPEVQKETNKDLVFQAIQDLLELGQLPYTLTIAKHLEMNAGNVNRYLQALLREGKIAHGKRQGKIQPYILVES